MKKTFTINEQGKITVSIQEMYEVIHDSYQAGLNQGKTSSEASWYRYDRGSQTAATAPFISLIPSSIAVENITFDISTGSATINL